MAKLKFTALSQDDSSNIIEMRGRYADFDKPGGKVILLRNQGRAYGETDFCDQVASDRGMTKIPLEDLKKLYKAQSPS